MEKLKLFTIYNPVTGLYVGIPKDDWKQRWVTADRASTYPSKSRAKQVRGMKKQEGLRIIRWTITQDDVC